MLVAIRRRYVLTYMVDVFLTECTILLDFN